jgi:hypothetical protein
MYSTENQCTSFGATVYSMFSNFLSSHSTCNQSMPHLPILMKTALHEQNNFASDIHIKLKHLLLVIN